MVDFAVAKAINQFGSGTFIDSLTKLVSSYAFLVIILMIILIFILIKDRKNGKIIVIALLIAMFLHFAVSEGVMKGIISFRERPYMAHSGEIAPLGKLNTDASFPSNHMSSTLAVLTVLIYYYRKYWPVALIFALMMAFARIHNGMHYPTDVLAGAVFGIAWGIIGIYSAKRISKILKIRY
jgi:undecaprenyl-diphosphatase